MDELPPAAFLRFSCGSKPASSITPRSDGPYKVLHQKSTAVLIAQEAGASKAELARALGVSRQRVDEVLTRARHERAAGVEDVTD
jgi:DNA invertase Pin-like site-specific DNA recombinase